MDALQEFSDNPLFSYTAFSETYLEIKTQAALQDAQHTAIDRFARDFTVIQAISLINGLMTSVATNFVAITVPIFENEPIPVFLVQTAYQLPGKNHTCSCHTEQSCQTPAGLYLFDRPESYQPYDLNTVIPDMTIPGIMFDCLPSLMVLASSLECFYDQSCIDTILALYTRKFNISILDETRMSHFPPKMILKEIIDQLFIEEILNKSSFAVYYEKCAPIACSYTCSNAFHLAKYI
ncbi:unnamed protein product [Rotaria sp. Silwood1]|nr:unnamed protein product [Rotaria sp. Silwood1]